MCGESHQCAHSNFGSASQERLSGTFTAYRLEQPGHTGCFLTVTTEFMANILNDKNCHLPDALQRDLAEAGGFFKQQKHR